MCAVTRSATRKDRRLRTPAREGRIWCRLNFEFKGAWQGRYYAIKQVAPVIVEEPDRIVVVTVYTFFF